MKDQLLNSIEKSKFDSQPFNHWCLRELFSEATLQKLRNLPSKAPCSYNGTRVHENCLCRKPSSMLEKTTGGKVFFTESVCKEYPVCQQVVDLFQNPVVVSTLERICKTDFSGCDLRIGYYADKDGFFIAPHTDVYQVKTISIVIYLDAPGDDLGIELLDEDFNIVETITSRVNTAIMFLPGPKTWHQVSKKHLSGPRKTLVINYVNDRWCNKQQLCSKGV